MGGKKKKKPTTTTIITLEEEEEAHNILCTKLLEEKYSLGFKTLGCGLQEHVICHDVHVIIFELDLEISHNNYYTH